MENLLSRYRNVSILVGVVFLQLLGLSVQVKRNTENQSNRLIRVWAVGAVTPVEKTIIWFKSGTSNMWHDYVYLRGVRQENRDLRDQIEKLQLEQVRIKEDAEQARRLQALLGFKEQFISKTVAAQVIGTGGSDRSRIVYIDKGENDGLRRDMPVITADGIVGKVLQVINGSTSQVLLINDQTSGAGAILEKSRLQGILKGSAAGEVVMDKVMADETVQAGETVLTSGGDQIYPKGLKIGTVVAVDKGKEAFLNIRVKPAANLGRLEEVLVITKQEEHVPSVAETGPVRAVDILAERLPSVPQKPAEDPAKVTQKTPANAAVGTVAGVTAVKPQLGTTSAPKVQPNSAGGVPKAPNTATVKPVAAPDSAKIPQAKPAADIPTEQKASPTKDTAEDQPQ